MENFIIDRFTRSVEYYYYLDEIQQNINDYQNDEISDVLFAAKVNTERITSDLFMYNDYISKERERHYPDNIHALATLHNSLTYCIDKAIIHGGFVHPEDYDEQLMYFRTWHENLLFKNSSVFRKYKVQLDFSKKFNLDYQLETWHNHLLYSKELAFNFLEYFKRLINIRLLIPYLELKLEVIFPFEWNIRLNTKGKRKITSKKIVNKLNSDITKGFDYKHWDKMSEVFPDFAKKLRENKLIDNHTSVSDIKRAFSDQIVVKPIKWIGGISSLYTFVKLLHNKHQVIENCKQKQWKITAACFVDSEGEHFDFEKFRVQKDTTNVKTIERIVQMLVPNSAP